jgi:glutamate racemase
VQAVADLSPKRVAFIATEATVRSGMFVRLLNQASPGIQVQARACPLFVPLIEEGWVNHKVTQLVTEAYLEDLKDTGLDALVLGCTHYPLLTDLLTTVLGDIRLINMAQYTVQALRDRLTQKDMLSADSARYTFFVSGYSDKFDQMARMILHEAYTAEKTSWV